MEGNLKESLNKCSRCAICAEACPLFKIIGQETVLTRGKFTQLLGVIKGDLKYSKKIEENLNMCLNCSRCKGFCPSDIDAVKIFSKIKFQNMGGFKKVLTSELFFKLKFLIFNIFKRKFKEQDGEIHFFGCVSKYKNGFKCCGMPHLASGRYDLYEKYMKHNIEITKNKDVKKIVFHCATCYSTFKDYEIDEDIKEKMVFEPDFKVPKKEKFTFHKPCHMDNKIYEVIDKKLKENENYVSNSIQNCCGLGGEFFIRHPIISIKLMYLKHKEIRDLGVKKAVTSCPLCKIGLFIGKITSGCIDVLNLKLFDDD